MQDLKHLRQTLNQRRHRSLVILSGQPAWQRPFIERLWQASESVLWIGDASNDQMHTNLGFSFEPVESKQLIHRLGQEVDGVVIDVTQGLSANTLGIAAGMIRAGGLLILLTPDIERWRTQPNPDNRRFLNSPLTPEQAHPYFIDHLINQWQDQKNACHPVTWFQENNPSTSDPLQTELSPNSLANISLPTQDQQQALQLIHTVAFGHRKRPLVISADRGRGKSSLLGLAAIQCLLEGKQHIVLTASRLDQAKMAFEHALKSVHQAQKANEIFIETEQPGRIRFVAQGQLKTLEFIAPDQLILEPTLADVLMVDEAAHLPTPLLTQLLHRHHRMVFATTLHGYEGSGRGFELRFKKTLNQLTPDWKHCVLTQAVRWADNDPLEGAINRALFLQPCHRLLAPKPSEQPSHSASVTPPAENAHPQIELKEIPIASLIEDAKQLHALFELLVQAHYQTSPNDLQQLLSAPNIRIIIAQNGDQLAGVLLCIEEGKIMPNTTRMHGHLIPQLLVKHYALADFLMLSTWRVMRIAVHPRFQRTGIGKQLLAQLHATAQQARIDYLSSSFGASEELLPFWFEQGYKPMHVGVKRDKASSSHNVAVGQALTPMAQQALACIQRGFQAQFPHTLMESLPYMPATMILAILKTFRFKTQVPMLEEAASLYQLEQRAYESISGQLWEWSIRNPLIWGAAPADLQAIWCDKVLKKQSWQEVAHQHHLAGRKAVESAMRRLLEQNLKKPKTLGAVRSQGFPRL